MAGIKQLISEPVHLRPGGGVQCVAVPRVAGPADEILQAALGQNTRGGQVLDHGANRYRTNMVFNKVLVKHISEKWVHLYTVTLAIFPGQSRIQ